MKKKLTLVSFYWHGRWVMTFVMAEIRDNKAVVRTSLPEELFEKFYGISPQIGDTISIG